MSKFPTTLYVTEEKDGDDVFFIVNKNTRTVGEFGETVDCAIYKLVSVKKAVNKTELVDK